jgi:hypothetical protein
MSHLFDKYLQTPNSVAVDGDAENEVFIFRQVGKVKELRKKIYENKSLNIEKTFISHVSMAHTRWFVEIMISFHLLTSLSFVIPLFSRVFY